MSDNDELISGAPINIGHRERTISAIAGSLLLYYVTRKHKAGALLALAGGYLTYRGISGHCPLYSLRDRRLAPDGRNINVRTHVVVSRPRDVVYAFWRKLENLNLFMEHVQKIRELDDKRSSWTIKIPGGFPSLQWEAEIVKEEEGKEISWQSAPGSSIENAGKINFSDTPAQGTRIDALISYRAPFGTVGEGLSRLLTPLFRRKIEADIYNFKYYMENTSPAI
jgi:uncharacterized membrane protein